LGLWNGLDEGGCCVGAATKVLKGSDDVLLAEAVGIREALNWVVSQQHHRVIIETDTEVIVKAPSKKNFPRTNWGNVIRNCSRDLEGLSHVSVTWVNRKGNQEVHGLTRLAISKPNMFWFNNFPACILSHILSDMEV
jgi:hypothetical protein